MEEEKEASLVWKKKKKRRRDSGWTNQSHFLGGLTPKPHPPALLRAA